MIEEQQLQKSNGMMSFTTVSACFGATVWVLYLLMDVMTNGLYGWWVERLFLLAPLVVLPLALWMIEYVSDRGTWTFWRIAIWFQPVAALSLVVAFSVRRPALSFLPESSDLSVYLSLPWLAFCSLLAIAEGEHVLRMNVDNLTDGMIIPPVGFLQVGAFWLMIDQMGIAFMGITEPIRLLTAVHFHFTGFGVLVLLAGLHGLFRQRGRGNRAFLAVLAAGGVTGGIPLVAIGFVGADIVKSTGVIGLSVAVVLGAVLLFQSGRFIRNPLASVFVRGAAGCVVIGMILATVFQVTLHLGRPVLSIPVMTVSHGVLNGIGFMVLGLLGVRTGLLEEAEES